MASFFHTAHFANFQPQNPHPMPQPSHHHGRSRRAPRLSASQNSHRQMRMPKNVKEVPLLEPPNLSAYRARFEAGRSFDLEDDLEFCPNLLTNDERQSIYSGSSDRSSLSSGSPDASPTQHQIQPHHVGPAVNVTSAATSAFVSPPTFISAMANNNNSTHNINNTLKIHQPSPYRVRNPLPIVDPNNRSRVASPPSSVSPGVMQSSSSTGHRYQ